MITTQTEMGPLGMTANSFSSISLDPALVLWSPARHSQRHNAFVGAEVFTIHVLCDTQLNIARHFATEGMDFSLFEWTQGPLGTPTLAGVLAEFHCSTFAVHPAGDHSLILGQVRHVVQHSRAAEGLLFSQGRFGSFAPKDTKPQ